MLRCTNSQYFEEPNRNLPSSPDDKMYLLLGYGIDSLRFSFRELIQRQAFELTRPLDSLLEDCGLFQAPAFCL